MSFISIVVMLVFVVPQFKQMFDNADQELPLITQVVLTLADALLFYGWLIVPFVVGVVVVIRVCLKDPKFQMQWD